METKKTQSEALIDGLNKKLQAKFKEVLKEAPLNRMSVGSAKKETTPYCIYYPHNLRLYFDFNKEKFYRKKAQKLPKPTPNTLGLTHRLKNSKEHEFNSYHGCRLTIKKTQIEIQNKINPDRKYKMPLNTDAHIKARAIMENKISEAKAVLKMFIKEFGGHSSSELLNTYVEVKIWHEKMIDRLPYKLHWHGQLSKKVYKEQNVEFYNAADACNYVENRAFESVAPVVAEELQNTRKLLKGILYKHDPLGFVCSKIDYIDDIMNCREYIAELSQVDKTRFEEWLFTRFGG